MPKLDVPFILSAAARHLPKVLSRSKSNALLANDLLLLVGGVRMAILLDYFELDLGDSDFRPSRRSVCPSHVLALLVDAITDWSWLYLISIPGMLTVVREALFKVTSEGSDVEWFHAGPVLAILVAGAVAYAWSRLQRAEVIT